MYRPRRGRRPLTRQALPPSSAEEHPKGHSIDEGERTISSAEKQWAEDISSQRKRMHDVRVDISQGQESKGRDGHHCPSETHSRLEASNFRPPKAHGPPKQTTVRPVLLSCVLYAWCVGGRESSQEIEI